MRTPSELMELFVYHESKNDIDSFAKVLSYEEVTMIMMTIELMKKHPSLTKSDPETLQQALEFFGKIRKEFIERN